MHGLGWMIPIVIVAVLALIAMAVLGLKGKGSKESPYQKEPCLFTPAEMSFLVVLEQAIDNEFRIMGKVRLADVLKVRPGMDGKARSTAFNRIQSKHLDFVACDPHDFSLQFAVELDDKSHDRPDRQSRDAFLDEAMEKAGIPIIRFVAKRSYSAEEIRATIISRVNQENAAVAERVEEAEETSADPAKSAAQGAEEKQGQGAIKCPACGGDMIRRKAVKGANAGNEFWGCSNYPKCKKIL